MITHITWLNIGAKDVFVKNNYFYFKNIERKMNM